MKNYLETAVQIIFLAFFSILVILISLGIEQDFSKIQETSFWIEVALRLGITIIIFNVIYYMDRRNRMHNNKSRFFRAYATNRLRIREIENGKRYDELDVAVENKNKEILRDKINRKLHRLCTRANYEECITEEPIEYLIKRFRVRKRRQLLFKILVYRIRSGQIRVWRPVKAEMFLQDKELVFGRADNYDFNNVLSETTRNLKKAFTFLVCSILTATITFSFTNPNFWETLLTNITLFLGAMASGFMSSSSDIKRRTAIYEKRNSFLQRYLDITVEYKEETSK